MVSGGGLHLIGQMSACCVSCSYRNNNDVSPIDDTGEHEVWAHRVVINIISFLN